MIPRKSFALSQEQEIYFYSSQPSVIQLAFFKQLSSECEKTRLVLIQTETEIYWQVGEANLGDERWEMGEGDC